MFGSEKRVLTKHYLDQGLSQSAVAELLGISRRTLHRWIQQGAVEEPVVEPRYTPRPPVVTKLDAFKPIIKERLTLRTQRSRQCGCWRRPGGRIHGRLHAIA